MRFCGSGHHRILHSLSNLSWFLSSPGRPVIPVDIEDIEYLRGLRFSWTEIAKILGISRSTPYRRLQEAELSLEATYTAIDDADLDRVIESIKETSPNDGERMMMGHLARLGIIVPRVRIRSSIHRVDPINTAIRRSVTVRRRVYHVEGPNSLWHIDGNHKLIRWRFVIHGGIDGYSRTVVFLRCSTNNEARTVFSPFEKAVQDHGLPNRVRSDLGGENVDVWRYMIEQHSSTSAVVTGSSTHNERIERLWRDVFRCVGVLFYNTFRKLEEDNHLDCLNEVDLFCLHWVFTPRINAALESFVESWNNHPVSTARNRTPNQLFIQGAMEQGMVPTRPPSCLVPDSNRHPSPRDHVTVPHSMFSPCRLLSQQIERHHPLQQSRDFGCSIYRVVSVVGCHLSHGCDDCSV